MKITKSMYWVIDDLRARRREAFVCDSDDLNGLSYSGYYTVATFSKCSEATMFCDLWNEGADPRFMNTTINGVAIKSINGSNIELIDGTKVNFWGKGRTMTEKEKIKKDETLEVVYEVKIPAGEMFKEPGSYDEVVTVRGGKIMAEKENKQLEEEKQCLIK